MELIKIKEVDVILQDQGDGRGKIIISSPMYNSSYFWGSMGGDLKKFIKSVYPSYFAGKLCSNIFEFDGRESVKNVRKYIREELSYELPWYKFKSAQKELRKKLKEIEGCDNQYDFINSMSNIHKDLLIIGIDYEEEKEFLKILEDTICCEPWHFIGQKNSCEYDFYTSIHKQLKKLI